MKTKINAGDSTRINWESGRDAAVNFSPAVKDAVFVEKPVLTIYLPSFRPPSLNEIIKQHWTRLQVLKARCSNLMRRAKLSLHAAMGQQDRLTLIILWEGSKSCGTKLPNIYSADSLTPKKMASSGSIGSSRDAAAKWKSFKRSVNND